MGDIAQLTLGHTDQMPEEILQLANNSPIGVIYPDQANWLLLVHVECNLKSLAFVPTNYFLRSLEGVNSLKRLIGRSAH
jgi:hypothetical protein